MHHDAYELVRRLGRCGGGTPAGDTPATALPRARLAPPVAEQHAGSWEEKLDAHWDAVRVDATLAPVRSLTPTPIDPAWLRDENLATAFSYDGDLLPRTGSVIIDAKMVHRVGAVARCSFAAAADNGCRGILGHGGAGLMRVSNGNSSPHGGFAPGVALKFPRSGMASADMLFGVSFAERGGLPDLGDGDFFSVDLQTWLGEIPLEVRYRDLRTLFWIFGRMREQQMGCAAFSERALSPLALCTHDQNGTPQPPGEDPVGLALHPTADVRAAWEKAWAPVAGGDADFRRGFVALATPLVAYVVRARFADESEREIGTLSIDSAFHASPYGDDRLFFRHAPECPHASVITASGQG